MVALKQLVPIRTPDDLDNIPTGAPKHPFKLIDDPLVPANRAIEPLQVAVDHEDQVIQFLSRTKRDRPQRVNLVCLAVTHKGPDLPIRLLDQTTILEVAHEPSLINGIQRTYSHRNRRETPEIGHQPGMRIAAQAGLSTKLVTEIFESRLIETPFQKCACIDTRRSMSLKVDEVARLLSVLRMEEVVEAHFEQCRQR